MSIMSGSNVQDHPFRVWLPSASEPNPAFLGPGRVSEAVPAEDTANSSEVAVVEDTSSEDRRANAMSSTPQISSTVVSAVILASQVASAEAVVINIEFQEVAAFALTIIAGIVGLILVRQYKLALSSQIDYSHRLEARCQSQRDELAAKKRRD